MKKGTSLNKICSIQGCFAKHVAKGFCRTHYDRNYIWGDPLIVKPNVHYGKESGMWKGDEAGYDAIHDWVRRQLGKPEKCENCGTTESVRFEWANISGEYLRDIGDWARLCVRCHRLIDNNINKSWKTRRKIYGPTNFA